MNTITNLDDPRFVGCESRAPGYSAAKETKHKQCVNDVMALFGVNDVMALET